MPDQEKKGAKKVKLDPLELNKETVENLSDSQAEKIQGGRAGSGTDVRSGCSCCSSPCVKKPR